MSELLTDSLQRLILVAALAALRGEDPHIDLAEDALHLLLCAVVAAGYIGTFSPGSELGVVV